MIRIYTIREKVTSGKNVLFIVESPEFDIFMDLVMGFLIGYPKFNSETTLMAYLTDHIFSLTVRGLFLIRLPGIHSKCF